jgi:cell division protein FtsB
MQISHPPMTDLSRQALIDRFRQRISTGTRTRLSNDEFALLASFFLDRLKSLNSESEIRQACEQEIALLEEGYSQASIGSRYLPIYRKLIQGAIEQGELPLSETNSHQVQWQKRDRSDSGVSTEHFALSFLKYDNLTYSKLREQTTANNNIRQDDLQPVPLELYLNRAVELLQSNQPETLAIALCALTGRRHTEIVSKGSFSATKYPYALHFEGQQKDPTPPFDILTLIPASDVLKAIERFRALPAVAKLSGLGHDHPLVDAFNRRVNTRTHKAFEGIVPVLTGLKTVSIHRLRGVYGAIAIHFFCPQMQNEHRFLQHYLGHLLQEQAKNLPNAPATQHYFHYRLVNEKGKVLTARGVKVMANGIAPIPETLNKLETQTMDNSTIQDAADALNQAPPKVQTKAKPPATKSVTLDVERLRAIAAKFDIHIKPGKGHGLNKAVEDLFEKIEAIEIGAVGQKVEAPPAMSQTVAHQAATLAWLTAEIETLRDTVKRLETQQAIGEETDDEQLSQLQAEIHDLKAENQDLKTALASHKRAINALTNSQDDDNDDETADDNRMGNNTRNSATASPSKATATARPDTPSRVSRPRKSGGAKARATDTFKAIQLWNLNNPSQAVFVNQALLNQDFNISRPAVQAFLEEFQQEVQQVNTQLGDSPRSRNKPEDVEALKKFVEQKMQQIENE